MVLLLSLRQNPDGQTIHINKSTSSIVNVSCGMPQGSSLGPKTFIAYTKEINSLFADHRLDHHCFADDKRYVATVPSQAHKIAPRLQHCIADVAAWCGARRLQLNPLKTEIMWFGSATAPRNLPSSFRAVNVGSDVVQPASVVRDLGVQLDGELSVQAHVSKTTQTCFLHLRRLRQVRWLLGRDVTANLVAARLLQRSARRAAVRDHSATATSHQRRC